MSSNVLVCGTGFGRVYLQALAEGVPGARLSGILARGSERSLACSAQYGVPLYATVDEVPAETDLAVVAVYAAVNGGPGSELARDLMRRGIHVVQEAPLHPDELAVNVRVARDCDVVYRVSTHYTQTTAVRRFVELTRLLTQERSVQWIELTCSLQVLYHGFDILRSLIGRLLPVEMDEHVVQRAGFSSLSGRVGVVDVLFRIQNEMHVSDPDNHGHLFHRMVVGTESGHLTLVTTHGPILWTPRPHFPAEGRGFTRLDAAGGGTLDMPCSEVLDARAPTYLEILGQEWPTAAGRTVEQSLQAIEQNGANRLSESQGALAVAQAWQSVSRVLAPPALHERPAPVPLDLRRLEVAR